MFANEPPVPVEPLAQARSAYPDRPWVWLPPGDPYWSEPPEIWWPEVDVVLGSNGNQRHAQAVVVDIAVPGRMLRPGDTILLAGTGLAFEARRFEWDEDHHVRGPIPDDMILLRLPDRQIVKLCVGYSAHPVFLAAAAAVVPVTADRRAITR